MSPVKSSKLFNSTSPSRNITFNCGPTPVTITMKQTAKIVNNTGPKIVIDGGGKVNLSCNNSTFKE